MSDPVIQRVRQALGRTTPLSTPPVPPALDEAVARLVLPTDALTDVFTRQARAAAMSVESVPATDLPDRLDAFLRANSCKSACLPVSTLLDRLNLPNELRRRGFDVHRWDAITADDTYAHDCGVTDAYAAVAETGSLVLRASAGHGRVLSLTPPIHVAIIEPSQILPDLVDLFAKVTQDGAASGVTLITGPSKTSDIEGQLVTGVHGPGKVHIFVLQ